MSGERGVRAWLLLEIGPEVQGGDCEFTVDVRGARPHRASPLRSAEVRRWRASALAHYPRMGVSVRTEMTTSRIAWLDNDASASFSTSAACVASPRTRWATLVESAA